MPVELSCMWPGWNFFIEKLYSVYRLIDSISINSKTFRSEHHTKMAMSVLLRSQCRAKGKFHFHGHNYSKELSAKQFYVISDGVNMLNYVIDASANICDWFRCFSFLFLSDIFGCAHVSICVTSGYCTFECMPIHDNQQCPIAIASEQKCDTVYQANNKHHTNHGNARIMHPIKKMEFFERPF